MSVRREDCLDVSKVTPVPAAGFASGVIARTLTVNDRTGGDHQVLEFPADWRDPDTGYVTSGQDIYVIEGDLTIGDAELVVGCYMYIPEGVKFGPMSSHEGCRAIYFHNKKHEFVRSSTSADDADESQFIGPVETWLLQWLDPMKDVVKKSTYKDASGKQARPPGVLTKMLRHNHAPKAREMVALTALAPGYIDPGTEHHPHDECLYLISGDACIGLTYDLKNEDRKEDLILKHDYYISRPPGIKHGPVCTQNGALWLLYMNDMYTGLYEEVPDWKARVRKYLGTATFR